MDTAYRAEVFVVIGLFWTKDIFPAEFHRHWVEVCGDGAMTFGVLFNRNTLFCVRYEMSTYVQRIIYSLQWPDSLLSKIWS